MPNAFRLIGTWRGRAKTPKGECHFFRPAVEQLESRRLLAKALALTGSTLHDKSDSTSLVLTAAATGDLFTYASITGVGVAGPANSTAIPAATIANQTRAYFYWSGLTLMMGRGAGSNVTGPKFTPAGGTNQSLQTLMNNGVAAPNNTQVFASGKWIATQSPPFAGLTPRSADLIAKAEVDVGPGAAAPAGYAVGVANDPWIFTPTTSAQLTTEVDLSNVWLEVDPDSPTQLGDAGIVVTTGFGTGNTPGQNILAQGQYQVGITNGTLAIGSLVLMGQTFNLTAGTTYWETLDLTASADMSSPSSSSHQTMSIETTTTTLTSSGTTTSYGQPVTLSASVSGAGSPTGAVSFYDGSTFLGSGTLNSAGQATLVTSALGLGNHALTAVYAGDNNFATSTSAALTQTVGSGATTISVLSSNASSVSKQPVTFDAEVSTTTGTPTGTVSFYDGGTFLGTALLDGSGTALFTTAALTAGNHTITAVYGGDSNFVGSTSGSLTQTVNPDTANVTLASSASSAPAGTPITFTATVSGNGGGQPTGGTVTFWVDGVLVGTVNLSASGTASITLNWLAVGTHQITACYSSDGLSAAAFSDPFQQTVTN